LNELIKNKISAYIISWEKYLDIEKKTTHKQKRKKKEEKTIT